MLEIKNLVKMYGKKKILDSLNLKIEEGKILGLLGPNGSGKTTLMKIIMNLAHQNSGEITLNGEKISYNTNKYISYLPDSFIFEKNKKVSDLIWDYKLFFEDFDENKAKELLKVLGINENEIVLKLSKGNKEKVQLILVLSRNAKLYILDEPIAGVDIVTRNEILKLIVDNMSSDSSAIITTHLISDIEKIFDEVCFLKDGSIDKVYNVEELRDVENKSVEELYIEYFGGKND